MKTITLKVGDLSTNCYLAIDDETNKTIIIDPGDEADFISTSIIENKLDPVCIVLTHGHYDHCLANLELKLNFNVPIYLHQQDLFLYNAANSSHDHFSKTKSFKLPPIDNYLENDQIILFGNSSLKVLHTPGHTPGSVCLYCENSGSGEKVVFTGDTLFSDSVGATDHKYSSKNDLEISLKSLIKLPKNSLIYPGHGGSSSLQNALLLITSDHNPF